MLEWIAETFGMLVDSAVSHARMQAVIDLTCGLVCAVVLGLVSLLGWRRAGTIRDETDRAIVRALSVAGIILAMIIATVACGTCIHVIVDPAGAIARDLLR